LYARHGRAIGAPFSALDFVASNYGKGSCPFNLSRFRPYRPVGTDYADGILRAKLAMSIPSLAQWGRAAWPAAHERDVIGDPAERSEATCLRVDKQEKSPHGNNPHVYDNYDLFIVNRRDRQ
jgi:hypothetical protein